MLLAVPVALIAKDAPCKDVKFGDAVLAAYPNAVMACQGIKVKDNVVYAHYIAEVKGANKDEVTVVFKDYEGKDLTKIKFAPGDATAKIDGSTVEFARLREGTKLDLYIRESKWGIYACPGAPQMTILSRVEL